MRKLRITVFLPILLLASTNVFGSMLPEPEDYRLCTFIKSTCVEVSVKNGTTAYSGKGEKLWHINGWFRDGYLSDDGTCFIAGYEGMLPKEGLKEPALIVWENGEKRYDIPFDAFISDVSELRDTAGGYYWGQYLGIVDRNYFYLTTASGKAIYVNFREGTVHERNYLAGSMEDAKKLYDEGAFINATNIWKYNSSLGDFEAKIKLAHAFVWGRGVHHSFDNAIQLLEEAISLGSVEASLELEGILELRKQSEWRKGRLRPKSWSSPKSAIN